MRIIKLAPIVIVAIALLTSSCGSGNNVTGIQLYPVNPSTFVGSQLAFSVTVSYSNNTQQTLSASQVSWSSSNTTIASIDANGIAKGLAAGSTTITAAANGKNSLAVLTVAQ